MFYVRIHSSFGYIQLVGDFFILHPHCDMPQHLDFT